MTSLLLFFSMGIMAAGYLPALPSLMYVIASLLFISLLCIYSFKKSPAVKILVVFWLGITYGICAGYFYLSNQLSNELVGKDIIVEGQVIDLPEEDNRRQLFSLAVKNAYTNDQNKTIYTNFPSKINLSSYEDLRVKTGEYWQLSVKLKRPRGFVNPGGYDYQVSLLRRGIGAVG